MGERKVLNKYYPPDFDPSKIPRSGKSKQIKVRDMLASTIRCNTCGSYMGKGTKVNVRKEEIIGETYLGIKKFRFYMKCRNCATEIIYKTDPKNADYEIESGATRSFEPWRADDREAEEKKRKREDEELGNSMKSLENRSLDSKREMDKIAALEELKSLKSRRATFSVDAVLEDLQRLKKDNERKMNEDDDALARSIFKESSRGGQFVRRIDDEDIVDIDDDHNSAGYNFRPRRLLQYQEQEKDVSLCQNEAKVEAEVSAGTSNPRKFTFKSSTLKVSVKSKPSATAASASATASTSDGSIRRDAEQVKQDAGTGLQSLCQQYDSEEDD